MIKLKRVYEPAEPQDGIRILVERLWPRGVSKEKLKLDRWLKDVAPSDSLRTWFSHDPRKWEEFTKRYRKELLNNYAFDELKKLATQGDITFLFSARDLEHNNAIALEKFLEEAI